MPRRLVVISGAGLSAESGLATFRDAGGIWSQFNLDEVCKYSNWRRNRGKVFDFYAKRKEEVLAAQPNDAHRRLAAWQAWWGPERVKLLTQNVDDLLERAGATEVTHLHGELTTLLCENCFRKFGIGQAAIDPNVACPQCGDVDPVKPGVVFFGEASPAYHVLRRVLGELRAEDILLVVGTSMQVLTVDKLVPSARAGDDLVWQVNPELADQRYFGRNIRVSATEGLAQLEPLLMQLMAPLKERHLPETPEKLHPTAVTTLAGSAELGREVMSMRYDLVRDTLKGMLEELDRQISADAERGRPMLVDHLVELRKGMADSVCWAAMLAKFCQPWIDAEVAARSTPAVDGRI